jgi:hypothetical protein
MVGMRHILLLLALAAFGLTACVSSPLPLAGGQVQRDRACQWQHMELHLVLDQAHEHLKGTARLHVLSLEPATHSITLDLGSLRLAAAVKDSAGRELELIASRGPLREFKLGSALARGEEEVLEVRFDGTPGPGLRFENSAAGDWVRLVGGGFFPHVQGRGHFPTLDVTVYADGELSVVGPGQRLPVTETGIGPAPAHFRIADATQPSGVNFLVGPMGSLALSNADQGWCVESGREAAQIWAQAWMQARATDAQPGAACRVVFLPQGLEIAGWQGGWVAIPLGPVEPIAVLRETCRRMVIEQNLVRGLLPDSEAGSVLVQGLVRHAQASEGLEGEGAEPNRMSRGLLAMEQELGAAAFENVRTEFLELYRGRPLGVWEWARFAEHRAGFSAQALFETLTGR